LRVWTNPFKRKAITKLIRIGNRIPPKKNNKEKVMRRNSAK
tara:strand:- start:758 stop:880 length:123 start_codon:yes stop_codon:yes gene_type:complete